MADWWSPAISAAAGLGGVALGGWLTRWKDRDQRRHDFRRRQLEEFYAPFCALRQEIRAKDEVRVRVSRANQAEWSATFERVSPHRIVTNEKDIGPTFERALAYDNEQFKTKTMPAFRGMLALFKEKLALVEESTRVHYPALVEFVEVWNRALADAIPRAVPERIGHGEEALHELYADAERHRVRLVRRSAEFRRAVISKFGRPKAVRDFVDPENSYSLQPGPQRPESEQLRFYRELLGERWSASWQWPSGTTASLSGYHALSPFTGKEESRTTLGVWTKAYDQSRERQQREQQDRIKKGF